MLNDGLEGWPRRNIEWRAWQATGESLLMSHLSLEDFVLRQNLEQVLELSDCDMMGVGKRSYSYSIFDF